MNTLPLIVVGAGGHAIVVADALIAAGRRVLGFTDPDVKRHGETLCGLPVLGDDAELVRHTPETLALANGIGGAGNPSAATLRRSVQQRLEACGWHFVTVRHPAAIVSPFARIGDAVQLLAASVIQAGADVGEGCIVNTAAIVEHDVALGSWSHVAPRAVVCGNVIIGERCHIGAGSVVRQALRLANDTIVGAGAVVVKDCPQGGLFVGVPARMLKCET